MIDAHYQTVNYFGQFRSNYQLWACQAQNYQHLYERDCKHLVLTIQLFNSYFDGLPKCAIHPLWPMTSTVFSILLACVKCCQAAGIGKYSVSTITRRVGFVKEKVPHHNFADIGKKRMYYSRSPFINFDYTFVFAKALLLEIQLVPRRLFRLS